MKFLIRAAEQMYNGLYGMEDIAVVDVEHEDEAAEIGTEMSMDVMDAYECISSELYDEDPEICNENYEDNIYFQFWPLKDDAPDNIPTGEDWEDFLRQWELKTE